MDEKEFDYINVIPLVDVMLVLLTIVLTTSSFIATGMIPIELPQAKASHVETLRTQTIEIDGQRRLYLNSCPLTLSELGAAVNSLNRQTPVLIRADRDIALQVFVDVIDLIKTKGFAKVSLQTEELK
ncbi:MAG: biopolymer transporter ExbD [Smithellaceae bacterium]|nr:biopolymer transporter ExbD [Smithellaceae bacterium]